MAYDPTTSGDKTDGESSGTSTNTETTINDTTTLNGALQQLGETLATNLNNMGVTAYASDGLTTLAEKINEIPQKNGTYVTLSNTSSQQLMIDETYDITGFAKSCIPEDALSEYNVVFKRKNTGDTDDAYETIGSSQTSQDGQFRYTMTPPQTEGNYSVRAEIEGDSSFYPSMSQSKTFTVLDYLYQANIDDGTFPIPPAIFIPFNNGFAFPVLNSDASSEINNYLEASDSATVHIDFDISFNKAIITSSYPPMMIIENESSSSQSSPDYALFEEVSANATIHYHMVYAKQGLYYYTHLDISLPNQSLATTFNNGNLSNINNWYLYTEDQDITGNLKISNIKAKPVIQ